jgi:thioredoxin 1
MSIVHVSDDSFEAKVLKSSRPVLVDFWAEWCGPCKMIAPILEQIAVEYQDRLEIAKVDVEGSQSTAMKYGIRSIPTLMLFKDGLERLSTSACCRRNNCRSFSRPSSSGCHKQHLSHYVDAQSKHTIQFHFQGFMHERLSRQFSP